MAVDPIQKKLEKVLELLENLVKESSLPRAVSRVTYREDYQDFRVILEGKYYAEIREKIIDDYFKTQHIDCKNEIIFKLEHSFELDEYEREEESGNPPAPEQKDIEIDDKEKYDFI